MKELLFGVLINDDYLSFDVGWFKKTENFLFALTDDQNLFGSETKIDDWAPDGSFSCNNRIFVFQEVKVFLIKDLFTIQCKVQMIFWGGELILRFFNLILDDRRTTISGFLSTSTSLWTGMSWIFVLLRMLYVKGLTWERIVTVIRR